MIIYPFAAKTFNRYRDEKLNIAYDSCIEKLDRNYLNSALKEAELYNNDIFITSPYVITEKQNIRESRYEELLDFTPDGILAILKIPAIELNIPVYHYSSDEVLSKGAGHVHGSSLPVGGESSNSVIIAHSGLPGRKLFDDIEKLKAGDVIEINVCGETLAYKVTQTKTVLPEKTSDIKIEKGKDLITLVSCTPYGINTHRIIVTAERYYPENDEKTVSKQSPGRKKYYFALFIPVLILTVILMIKEKKW